MDAVAASSGRGCVPASSLPELRCGLDTRAAVLTCLAQAPSLWHPLEHPTAEQVLDLHQTHALHHWPQVALAKAQLIQVPTWAYELTWGKPSFQPPG